MVTSDGSSGRELIGRVLRGERAGRLPRAVFGGGLWSYRQAGLAIGSLRDDPAAFGDRLADVWAGIDTDIVFVGSGLNTLPAEAIGGELKIQGGQAPLLAFPIIQCAEDARDLDRVDLAASPHAHALVEMIAQVRRRLPDRYLCATSWGPFTWCMILCEWGLLQERTVSDRGFVADVCDLGVRLSGALFGALAARGLVDGACISDGAATLVPTDLYREVVLPRERRLFDAARAAGLARFLHQCGKIAPQLALYPETGADCVSVDAVVPIGEAYARYRDRTVTAGNVDVIDVVRGGDEATLRAAVDACVEAVADPLRRFILMPSCDLPADTDARSVRAFLAAADGANFDRSAPGAYIDGAFHCGCSEK
jgi:uroporphyrinogen-III decarboxylase